MLRRLLFAVRSRLEPTVLNATRPASRTAAATAEYENKDNDPPTTAKSTTVHK